MVSEWEKACRQRGEQPGLYYRQSNTQAEVDLIIEQEGGMYGIEVKTTATPPPGHADGLARWMGLSGPSAHGALACQIDRPVPLGRGIKAIPWYVGWLAE